MCHLSSVSFPGTAVTFTEHLLHVRIFLGGGQMCSQATQQERCLQGVRCHEVSSWLVVFGTSHEDSFQVAFLTGVQTISIGSSWCGVVLTLLPVIPRWPSFILRFYPQRNETRFDAAWIWDRIHLYWGEEKKRPIRSVHSRYQLISTFTSKSNDQTLQLYWKRNSFLTWRGFPLQILIGPFLSWRSWPEENTRLHHLWTAEAIPRLSKPSAIWLHRKIISV